MSRKQKKQAQSVQTVSSPVAQLLVLVILVLTGASLVSQTKVVRISSLQSSVLERVTQALLPSQVVESTNSTSRIEAIDPGKFHPFSCSKLLRELKKLDGPIQKQDPNKGVIYSRRTITEPPFYIALHEKTFDGTRWEVMKTGYYYEKQLTAAFQKVLADSPPGSRVLDVGGNIGFYSLLSASQGPFIIDAFEPNLKNRMRFCESLNLNRWFRTEFNSFPDEHYPQSTTPIVNLYPFGVGQEEGTFVFTESKNPGEGAVSNFKVNSSHAHSVQIVTLDDFARERGWYESRPDIAVLKVDVEGFEYSVLEGAKELLRSKMIRNIFMEVSVRTQSEADLNVPCLKYLSGPAGYRLHKVGGWPGPGTPVHWANDDQLVTKILEKARMERALQLNLWWKMDQAASNSSSMV